MSEKLIIFSLLFLILFFAVVSQADPYGKIQVKKLKVVFHNFSQIKESGIPLECKVSYKGKNFTMLIKGDKIQFYDGYNLVLKNYSVYFIKLNSYLKGYYNCDWIEVEKNDKVYERFKPLNPFDLDLDSIPASNFECDYTDKAFIDPSGSICYYFDA